VKTLITACLMPVLLLSLAVDAPASEETETDRGSLEINANVIHDTREVTTDQHRLIGHEVAPHLFLEEKTQFEYQRRQESREQLSLVQKQLFLDSDIDARSSDFSTQSVLTLLFAEGSLEPSRVTGLIQYLETANMPTWIIGLIVVLGLVVVVCIGITFGKHLSHLLHGKKAHGE